MNPSSDQLITNRLPARQVAQAFYDAIAQGDIAGVLAALHAKLAWTEAEGSPYYSGTWQAPQEVVDKLLLPISRDWHNFTATPNEFLETADQVVVFGVYTGIAKATGKSMRAQFAHHWQIRDNKLAKLDMYADTLLLARALSSIE